MNSSSKKSQESVSTSNVILVSATHIEVVSDTNCRNKIDRKASTLVKKVNGRMGIFSKPLFERLSMKKKQSAESVDWSTSSSLSSRTSFQSGRMKTVFEIPQPYLKSEDQKSKTASKSRKDSLLHETQSVLGTLLLFPSADTIIASENVLSDGSVASQSISTRNDSNNNTSCSNLGTFDNEKRQASDIPRTVESEGVKQNSGKQKFTIRHEIQSATEVPKQSDELYSHSANGSFTRLQHPFATTESSFSCINGTGTTHENMTHVGSRNEIFDETSRAACAKTSNNVLLRASHPAFECVSPTMNLIKPQRYPSHQPPTQPQRQPSPTIQHSCLELPLSKSLSESTINTTQTQCEARSHENYCFKQREVRSHENYSFTSIETANKRSPMAKTTIEPSNSTQVQTQIDECFAPPLYADTSSVQSQHWIDVAPGLSMPLRGAQETLSYIRYNRIIGPFACISCNCLLRAVDDAEYVLCPICRVVLPMASQEHGDIWKAGFNILPGISLAFTHDDYTEWSQADPSFRQLEHGLLDIHAFQNNQ